MLWRKLIACSFLCAVSLAAQAPPGAEESAKDAGAPGRTHNPQNEMSWFILPIQPNFVASNLAR